MTDELYNFLQVCPEAVADECMRLLGLNLSAAEAMQLALQNVKFMSRFQ